MGFVRCWLILLLGATPCAAMLSFARPFSALARRLASFGAALCGWHGARVLGGKHTVILRDEDVFPSNNITSSGMKLYGTLPPGQVLSYALAALEAAQDPLAALFDRLLQAQFGRRCRADAYRCYDGGGIGRADWAGRRPCRLAAVHAQHGQCTCPTAARVAGGRLCVRSR